MKRINKTQQNLKIVWTKLDEACGLLYEADEILGRMVHVPKEVKDSSERVDKSAIVIARDAIGELIEDEHKTVGKIEHIID